MGNRRFRPTFFQIALTSRSDRIFAQDFFSRSSTRVDLSISGKSLGAGSHRSRRQHFEFVHPPPSGAVTNNRLHTVMTVCSEINMQIKIIMTMLFVVCNGK